MKVFLVFAFLIAGISATSLDPRLFSDERFITGQIESAIHDVSHAIRDAGMDPYHIEKESSSYELPVPVLFNYEAIIEDILSTGLSNIRIRRLSYSVIRSRLRYYDLEQFFGSARAIGEVFSNKLDFSASGKIDVVSVRVRGVVRVNVGLISGVSLRWVSADFSLGDINCDAKVVVMGEDVSADFNEFFGNLVPKTIKEHYREINQLLEIVLYDLISDIL